MPTDGPDADFSNARMKPKKGGAELGGGRAALFERVLSDHCSGSNNPAMELLVALHGWAVNKGNLELARTIASKCSHDSLASLAIVLQPYKASATYVLDGELAEFAAALGMTSVSREDSSAVQFSALPGIYTLRADPSSYYTKLADGCSEPGFVPADAEDKLQSASKALSGRMGKLNAVKILNDFYTNQAGGLLPADVRKAGPAVLFAEAELRVMSAMVLENSPQQNDMVELMAVYRSCKLDAPYMCGDKELVAGSNLGFYYSTVYLIARSDALNYVPGVSGANTSQVADDSAFISLSGSIRPLLASRSNSSDILVGGVAARMATPMY